MSRWSDRTGEENPKTGAKSGLTQHLYQNLPYVVVVGRQMCHLREVRLNSPHDFVLNNSNDFIFHVSGDCFYFSTGNSLDVEHKLNEANFLPKSF